MYIYIFLQITDCKKSSHTLQQCKATFCNPRYGQASMHKKVHKQKHC